jgi:broad specificity phosphatase PhoE
MANTWIIVRHPHKEGEDEGVYLGHDARITEKGKRQAEVLAERLERLRPDGVVSSAIPRAVELAEMFGHRLDRPVLVDPIFNEIDKPSFLVGLSRTDPMYESVLKEIREGFDDNVLPKGVSVKTRAELEEETRRAFMTVENYPMESIVLVCHAKRIASFVHWVYRNGTLEGFYQEADRHLILATTGLTILTRKPDRRTGEVHWHIETVNEYAHDPEV